MKEQWKPCFEGWYDVSDMGRIRRARRGPRTRPGYILKPVLWGNGYSIIRVYVDSVRKWSPVHRLVAEAFIGPCPAGKEVNHKDGIKSNNLASNLEYVTRGENLRHAWKSGLRRHVPQATVDAVRELRRQGKSYADIADATGVSSGYCSLLVRNKHRKQMGENE